MTAAVSAPDLGARVRFVLVGTTHPGNIGAAARALKVMGFARLVLAAPDIPAKLRGAAPGASGPPIVAQTGAGADADADLETDPRADPTAVAMAAGAGDVLARAELAPSLSDAIADCGLALGASARARSLGRPLTPAEAAEKIAALARDTEVAVVFGRESSGLSNAELELCHAALRIPTGGAFHSLNLAAAVQVVAYELRGRLARAAPTGGGARAGPDAPASADALERFYAHLETALTGAGFIHPPQSITLMRRFRNLFNRAHPSKREINMLRGMLSALGGERQKPS